MPIAAARNSTIASSTNAKPRDGSVRFCRVGRYREGPIGTDCAIVCIFYSYGVAARHLKVVCPLVASLGYRSDEQPSIVDGQCAVGSVLHRQGHQRGATG